MGRVGDIVKAGTSTRVLGWAAFISCALTTLILAVLVSAENIFNPFLDAGLSILSWILATFVAVAAGIRLVAHLLRRRTLGIFRSLVLFLGTGVLFLLTTALIGVLGLQMPYSIVYSKGRGIYYALCNRPALGDVLYQVAETPSLWRPIWGSAFDPGILDWSEDGSLASDPRLLLSGDESVLVISRGGVLTDAVVLDEGKNLVDSVPWDSPDREREWRLRTARVNDILRAHEVAAQ